MPSRYQIKPKHAANQTFHVTSRGAGNLKPFARRTDKQEFLDRLARYLSKNVVVDAARRPYEKLFDEVAVLAYCVLDTHFHLILHQFTDDGMERLMRRVLTSYGRYHVKVSGWRGPTFQGRYGADIAQGPDHLREMLGYTILNDPIQQLGHEFSSNAIMLGERTSTWLRSDLALGVFGGVEGYRSYMNRTGPARVASKLKRWGIDPADRPYRPI